MTVVLQPGSTELHVAHFRVRQDFGRSPEEWPPDIKAGVRRAIGNLRVAHPYLGRLIDSDCQYENKPTPFASGFPYVMQIALIFEINFDQPPTRPH